MGGGQIRTLLVRCALLKASATIAACCCQPPAVAGPPSRSVRGPTRPTPDPSGPDPRPASRQSPPRPGEGDAPSCWRIPRPRRRRTSNRQGPDRQLPRRHRAATQPATPSPAMRPVSGDATGPPEFHDQASRSRLDRARRPLFDTYPTHGHGRPRRRTPPDRDDPTAASATPKPRIPRRLAPSQAPKPQIPRRPEPSQAPRPGLPRRLRLLDVGRTPGRRLIDGRRSRQGGDDHEG